MAEKVLTSPMEKHGFVCLVTLGVLFAILSVNAGVFHGEDGKGSRSALVRQAVLSLLAVPSLSLSPECAGRNRIEGIYGAMSDIPGGYCFLQSCDLVGAPFSSRSSRHNRQSRKAGK